MPDRFVKTQWFRDYGGMTLVEVIVSMAIIAVVAMVVVGTFASTVRLQEVSRDHADSSAAIEQQISSHGEPEVTEELPEGGLSLGGFSLPSTTQSYSSGSREYTTIDGNNAPQLSEWHFGDGAGNGAGHMESGAGGGSMEFTVLMSGVYQLEAWGAQGNGAWSSVDWHGAYALCYIYLNKGDVLRFVAGGFGADGKPGGTSSIALNGLEVCSGGGGEGQGGSHGSGFAGGDGEILLGDQQMPDPLNLEGPTITGKSGGGYVRVVWLSD